MNISCILCNKKSLQEAEHYDLRYYDTHEHRQRIDCGISHGRSVVAAELVGIGQGRRIGVVAAHHADDLQIIHLIFAAGHYAYHHQRYHRDQEAVAHPECALEIEDRLYEILARRQSDGGEE